MPRGPNKIQSVELRIRTTPRVAEYLNELVAEQLYGKTPPEVAEELVRKGIKQLLEKGLLSRRKA